MMWGNMAMAVNRGKFRFVPFRCGEIATRFVSESSRRGAAGRDEDEGSDMIPDQVERLIRGTNLDFCIAHVISKRGMPVALGHMSEHDVELTFARTRNKKKTIPRANLLIGQTG
jgi:hypothetical protein